jgi:hypothetical protein
MPRLLLYLWLLTGVWLASAWPLLAQEYDKPAHTLEEQRKRYKERITLSHIYDVYIPTDVMDAMRSLDKLTSSDAREKYTAGPESLVVERLFFSLGRWMILNWGFEEGSRLSHYLREMGVYHPDDMARVLMTSYHRYLRGVPLEMEAQVADIRERLRQEQLERIQQGTILHQERRPAQKEEE